MRVNVSALVSVMSGSGTGVECCVDSGSMRHDLEGAELTDDHSYFGFMALLAGVMH